jgi:hypothetical protein
MMASVIQVNLDIVDPEFNLNDSSGGRLGSSSSFRGRVPYRKSQPCGGSDRADSIGDEHADASAGGFARKEAATPHWAGVLPTPEGEVVLGYASRILTLETRRWHDSARFLSRARLQSVFPRR